jgi:hypothetical protein
VCGAWSVDRHAGRTDCVAEYAESRLTARTQRNADGRVHGTTIGPAADDVALTEGNDARAPSLKAVPHNRLTRFAAPMLGVAVGGVYLRVLRSPVLRILRRQSPSVPRQIESASPSDCLTPDSRFPTPLPDP